MIGRKIFGKNLFLVLCFFLTSCAVKSHLSKDAMEQIVGIYMHKEPYSPETVLELKEDFTYQMCYPSLIYQKARPVEGKWKYLRGSVILNSFLNVDIKDYNCFIDQVCTLGFHGDSIVLQLLSLYDNKPIEDLGVVFRFVDCMRKDTLLFSNTEGMICFPRDGVKSIIGVYGLEEIKVPPVGYYYIAHIIDCDFSTHKNVKLQRKGDTLIMRSKNHVGYGGLGIKKYKTGEYPFIKVEEATTKEAPCTTP